MSDLIERDKAMDVLDDFQSNVENCVGNAYAIARQQMIAIPSARPKGGRWIEVTNGRGGHECSECHDYAPSFQSGAEHLSRFCPNCGADMRPKGDINV